MTTDTLEPLAPETQAPAAPATELTLIERADLALDGSQTEKDLRELVAKSVTITEIKDKTGREQCHRAAMDLAAARIAIQKTGKAAREDATKFSKAVITREKELVDIVTPEETRLLDVRDKWDKKVEDEKAAAAAAEQARVTAIMARIDEFRSFADLAVQSRTSAMVEKLIDRLTALPTDGFAEFDEQATTVRAQTLIRMKEISDAKKADEDERAKAKADQEAAAAKLAADRADFERQQAATAAAQAKHAADLKAEQDAHAAKLKADQDAHAAELQRQRDADAADLKRRQDEFAAEMAARDAQLKAEREAQQAEAARLQAQADELERKRVEMEPKPEPASVEPSSTATISAQEIVDSEREFIGEMNQIVDTMIGAVASLPVTMAAPEPAFTDASDADVIFIAARAVADTFGLSIDAAITRLSTIEWQLA